MNISSCVTLSASQRAQLSPALGNWIRVRSHLLHPWASLTLFAFPAFRLTCSKNVAADLTGVWQLVYEHILLSFVYGWCMQIKLAFRGYCLLLTSCHWRATTTWRRVLRLRPEMDSCGSPLNRSQSLASGLEKTSPTSKPPHSHSSSTLSSPHSRQVRS